MLIFQKFDKSTKHDGMFDDSWKFPNSNQIFIFFPCALIFGWGFDIGLRSDYALCEQKPILKLWQMIKKWHCQCDALFIIRIWSHTLSDWFRTVWNIILLLCHFNLTEYELQILKENINYNFIMAHETIAKTGVFIIPQTSIRSSWYSFRTILDIIWLLLYFDLTEYKLQIVKQS